MAAASFDAIVLGGGPGGYVCAIRLGQLGLKVACVEEEEVGGVCLNWGCIPSKALISTAHLYEKAKNGAAVGIEGSITLDVAKMQAWKDGVVKKLTGGVRTLLRAAGAEVIDGRGRFTSPKTVEVTLSKGGTTTLEAQKAIVVATGSATIEIPGFAFDGKRILGAREAVSLKAAPGRLLIVGGGVIGLELGMVYQKLGSTITVVEVTDSLLPGIDPEAVAIVQRSIKKHGGTVLLGTRAESWYEGPDGATVVRVRQGETLTEISCDAVLVSVGMKPRSKGIGLEALGVAIDERGFVKTDDRGQTNVPGVYAIGDVSGAPMLAHKASKEGEVVAEVIAGKAAGKDWVTVPSIIFTDPEIASVALAKADQGEVRVGKFPFAALGRAMSIRETDGFVKVVTDAKSGRVLAITICGPSASDLVSEAALALEMGATAEDLALTVHPHPTLGEALMEASAASLGHAIHIVNR